MESCRSECQQQSWYMTAECVGKLRIALGLLCSAMTAVCHAMFGECRRLPLRMWLCVVCCPYVVLCVWSAIVLCVWKGYHDVRLFVLCACKLKWSIRLAHFFFFFCKGPTRLDFQSGLGLIQSDHDLIGFVSTTDWIRLIIRSELNPIFFGLVGSNRIIYLALI